MNYDILRALAIEYLGREEVRRIDERAIQKFGVPAQRMGSAMAEKIDLQIAQMMGVKNAP